MNTLVRYTAGRVVLVLAVVEVIVLCSFTVPLSIPTLVLCPEILSPPTKDIEDLNIKILIY